jgi:hypothetical protein
MSASPEQTEISSASKALEFSGYVVRNSLAHPNDHRLSLIPLAVGEGYAPYDYRYLRKNRSLEKIGREMDDGTRREFEYTVAEKMLADKFSERATNFQVFARVTDQDREEFAATMGLVKEGNKRVRGEPDIELRRLLHPDRQDQWESVISEDPTITYGELRRIVVLRDFRERGLTTEIMQEGIDGENGIVEVAMKQGIDYLLMAAHGKLTRHIEQTSLEIVDRLPIMLRSAGKRVARSSPGYWDPAPELVVTKVPPNPTK